VLEQYWSAILLFTDTLTHAPETVGADGADHEQVGGGTETAGGQVALVLDGLVAAGGRHILRHDGRVVFVCVCVCVCVCRSRKRGRDVD
jgi:hypothetical protein